MIIKYYDNIVLCAMLMHWITSTSQGFFFFSVKFISISVNAEKIAIEISINECKILKFEFALNPSTEQIKRLVSARIKTSAPVTFSR